MRMGKLAQTIFLLFCVFFVKHAISDSQFTAAVHEHVFFSLKNTTKVPSRQEALVIIMENMNVYEQQIQKAKAQNASIIVFPEYGLTGFQPSREFFEPFLENIPDPTRQKWNACEDPGNSTTALNHLSCLAKDNDIYLLVNMGDIKPCSKSTDPHCPDDGRYQYNTNVVFDNHGLLIARYHKQHPFLNEMKVVNRPVEPEYITFETPFGKFATFTCFDVLFHDPAVPLVTKYNVDHVAFPTAWFDVLPLFAAIGFHSSWARGMGVNYLASNTHVPALQNTGSGIYSYTGARNFYRSLSENGSLVIASLPVSRGNVSLNTSLANVTSDLFSGNISDGFYSDLFGDLFFFKELSKVSDTLNVCYNNSKTCCSLTYKIANKSKDEMYALGVFDGLHTKEGQYYLRICTLIKCLARDSCGQQVYQARSIFESFELKSQLNTPYVFPQLVADGVTLLSGEWDHDFPVTSLKTTQRLSKGLLTAALFGRVYNLDPKPPSPTPPTTRIHSSTPTSTSIVCQVPSMITLLCLLFIQSSWL